MKINFYPKSLKELWNWKKEVYKDIKNFSTSERINYFKKETKDTIKSLGLKTQKPKNIIKYNTSKKSA